VILVDANILLYAEDSLSEHHETARVWWDEQLSGSEPVALCWPVLTAFLRIGTNARLHKRPLTLKEAIARVQSWLDQPCIRILTPTDQHWTLFQRMLHAGSATANLVSDAPSGGAGGWNPPARWFPPIRTLPAFADSSGAIRSRRNEARCPLGEPTA
jgi:toxin-antitoxin system PIN domain toxin